MAWTATAVRPADAVVYNGRSYGLEYSAPSLTGVAVVREDLQIAIPFDGCAVHSFSGNVVRQMQRVTIDDATGSWIEFGTANRCNYVSWWYAGINANHVWYPQWHSSWTVVNNPPQSHAFYIYRSGGGSSRYRFHIDATEVFAVDLSVTGIVVAAGLTSNTGGAIAPAHSYRALRYQTNNGGWVNWSGNDHAVNNMCGAWTSGASWRAAQNAPC